MHVTIRCERPDGQYVDTELDLPDDLLDGDPQERLAAREDVANQFSVGYWQAAQLPDGEPEPALAPVTQPSGARGRWLARRAPHNGKHRAKQPG